MKKILIIAVILFVTAISFSQSKTDSMAIGRNCKIVLFNGFQAEGRIRSIINDTLQLETEITNLHIPVKDIKFVMNPDFEVSDIEENDTLDYQNTTVIEPKIDTTDECDIYLDNKLTYKDVKLIAITDTSIKLVKEDRVKIINIAGMRKIVFKPSSPFGKGLLYGALGGFAFGFFALAFHDNHGESIGGVGAGVIFGLICAIPTGLVGGVIGVLASGDDVYLFDKGITPAKIKRVKYAMEKHY